jgi:hypothetical protein
MNESVALPEQDELSQTTFHSRSGFNYVNYSPFLPSRKDICTSYQLRQ